MGRIGVGALKTGMVLAEDVKDGNGRMLLNAGVSLTDKHLRIFKIWGVSEVDVEGVSREAVDQEEVADIDPALLAAVEAYQAERFRHNDTGLDHVAELLRYCTLRRAREMQAKGQGAEALPPLRPARAAEDQEAASQTGALPPVDPHSLVAEELSLGSLPMIFHKLVEVINDSRSSASDVAEIISNDTDLSARLLKLVNSAFYGMRSKIDTISRAVAIIGSNQLVSLAMGISVIQVFKGIPEDIIRMQDFWTHSLGCGLSARILASYHKTPNTERFFVAGLLHDIGRLVIFKCLPGYAKATIDTARRENILVRKAEAQVLGFTHEKLGGILLKRWKFPVSLEKNVRFHHVMDAAPNRLEAAIILFADAMVHALELGSSGERYVPAIPPVAWDTLGLPPTVISQTATQLDYQLDEVVKFFTSDD